MSETTNVTTCIVLTPGDLEKVDRMAHWEDRSRSAVIRTLIRSAPEVKALRPAPQKAGKP